MLEEVLERHVDLDGYVDSKELFNVESKYTTTLEKRLKIDVHTMRKSQNNGQLPRVGRIPTYNNCADGLTLYLIKKAPL